MAHWREATLVALILIAGPGAAPTTATLAPEGPPYEEVRTRSPMSGEVVNGVFIGSENAKADPASLFVRLPQAHLNEKLCLTLLSRDAAYFAKLAFDVSGIQQGKYRLSFPTKHAEIFRRYALNEMAVLGELKVDCESQGPAERIVPIAWGDDKAADTIIVLVNTAGYDSSILVESRNGDVKKFVCRSFDDGVSVTAFDGECSIKGAPSLKLETAKIARAHFGIQFPSIDMPLTAE